MGSDSDYCNREIPQSAEAADAEERFLILNHFFHSPFCNSSAAPCRCSLRVVVTESTDSMTRECASYLKAKVKTRHQDRGMNGYKDFQTDKAEPEPGKTDEMQKAAGGVLPAVFSQCGYCVSVTDTPPLGHFFLRVGLRVCELQPFSGAAGGRFCHQT